MSHFALPLGFALLVWWTATAIVMFLDGLPRRTFRWTLLGTTALQAAALYGLWKTRTDTSVAGAPLAFTCAGPTWGSGARSTSAPRPPTRWSASTPRSNAR